MELRDDSLIFSMACKEPLDEHAFIMVRVVRVKRVIRDIRILVIRAITVMKLEG